MAAEKSSGTESGSSTDAARVRVRKWPIVIAALVLMALGANYYLYVRSKTQYYTTRDLRLLSNLGTQIDTILGSNRQFVRNYADNRDIFPEDELVFANLSAERRAAVEGNFPGFAWLSRRCDAANVASRVPTFRDEIIEINGEQWLRISYFAKQSDADIVACGEVRLSHVLRRAFSPAVVEAFDSVLLVDGAGAILYRQAPQHQSSVRGFGIARRAHDAAYRRDVYGTTVDVRINNLGGLSERSGWNSYKPFDVANLGATRNSEVNVAGATYFLFTQPSPVSVARRREGGAAISAPAKASTSRPASPDEWTLCALVTKRRFFYEALAVSETVLAMVCALILVILAAWPFMRLSFISPFKPVRIVDAIFLGVSTIVVTAIFTLGIADAVVCRRLQAVSDVHLRQFSSSLDFYFSREITRALFAMDHLERNWDWTNDTAGNLGGFGMGSSSAYLDKAIPNVTAHPFQVFPYFSTFSWIDPNGYQAIKRSIGAPLPRVDVESRDYFKRVRDHEMWLIRPVRAVPPRPFALESLRSLTTGQPEVVISKPTTNPKYPVLAMTVTAAQLIDPVLPAGFTFAVIDDGGHVLFHSDTQKNQIENFFDESDQNRQFRSAVFARHPTHVDVRYGGHDYRAYIGPMENLPWLMVVLRDKQLMRTMNAETIVITIMCLTFLVAGAVLLTFVVSLARPRYRAAWIWPDHGRGRDYVRLSVALLCLVVAGVTTILCFESIALVIVSFALPLLALMTAFGALHQRRGWIFLATFVLWSSFAGIWIYAMTWRSQTSPLARDMREPGILIVIALLIVSGAIAVKRVRGGTPMLARRTHLTILGLLLVLVAVLPTLGFFKTAYRLEIQNLVKYSQLTLAERIQQRAESVIASGYRPVTTFAKRWEIPAAFNTKWWLLPPRERPPAAYNCEPTEDSVMLPEFVEQFLPQYSEDSVAMREMHHDTAGHQSWWWCRDGSMLTLHKIVRLPRAITMKLWPDEAETPQPTHAQTNGGVPFWPRTHPLGPVDPTLTGDARIRAQIARADRAELKMVVSSLTPSILPQVFRQESPFPYPSVPDVAGSVSADALTDPAFTRALRACGYVLAVIVAAAVLWWAIAFIARVVFLIDHCEPAWLTTRLRPRVGDHIFICRKRLRDLSELADVGFYRVELRNMTTPEHFHRVTAEVEMLAPGSSVLIGDFECGISAEVFSAKLALLEHLLRLQQCWIVVISTLAPPAIVAMAQAAGGEPEPWHAILKRFVWMTDDQLRPAVIPPPPLSTVSADVSSLEERVTTIVEKVRTMLRSLRPAPAALWLQQEASGDPMLAEIAHELRNDNFSSKAQVIDEFRERASSYYAMLWSACTDDEKALLCQLAREGLLNGKDRRSVRRLIGRGLIRRKPQLSLMNESFRAYVLSASAAEDVEVRHVNEQDTWTSVSRPLAFVLVVVIVMFLFTQKDLVNTASAIITALAGGIPAMIKLIGVLTDRRHAAA